MPALDKISSLNKNTNIFQSFVTQSLISATFFFLRIQEEARKSCTTNTGTDDDLYHTFR